MISCCLFVMNCDQTENCDPWLIVIWGVDWGLITTSQEILSMMVIVLDYGRLMVMDSVICQFVWMADLGLFLPKSWLEEGVIGFVDLWSCLRLLYSDEDSCLGFWADLVFLGRNWVICDSNGDKLSWWGDSVFMIFNHMLGVGALLVVGFRLLVTTWF